MTTFKYMIPQPDETPLERRDRLRRRRLARRLDAACEAIEAVAEFGPGTAHLRELTMCEALERVAETLTEHVLCSNPTLLTEDSP